jgi:hypothetical protein
MINLTPVFLCDFSDSHLYSHLKAYRIPFRRLISSMKKLYGKEGGKIPRKGEILPLDHLQKEV